MRSTITGVLLAAFGLALYAEPLKPKCPLPFAPIATSTSIDSKCGVSGDASGALSAQDDVKNNFCATGEAFALSLEDYAPLQAAAQKALGANYSPPKSRTKLRDIVELRGTKVGEGDVVQLIAYVDHARYSDVEDGESVNCHLTGDPDSDVHIPLVEAKGDEECTSVTAEISPHFRPASWTAENLNKLTAPVRITGQLFFDASHKPCTKGKTENPQRRAVWEIHPVYAIEVQSDGDWIPLDQFISSAPRASSPTSP